MPSLFDVEPRRFETARAGLLDSVVVGITNCSTRARTPYFPLALSLAVQSCHPLSSRCRLPMTHFVMRSCAKAQEQLARASALTSPSRGERLEPALPPVAPGLSTFSAASLALSTLWYVLRECELSSARSCRLQRARSILRGGPRAGAPPRFPLYGRSYLSLSAREAALAALLVERLAGPRARRRILLTISSPSDSTQRG